MLQANPNIRILPGVAAVIEKSNVLEARIRSAYTRPGLRPMALRIIHALSVDSFTVHDNHAPLGVTPEELRDDLCLYRPLPEPSADCLLDQVQTVNGVSMISAQVDAPSVDVLREMTDWFRDRLGSGVFVLGTVLDGRPALVASITADVVEKGADAVGIVPGFRALL